MGMGRRRGGAVKREERGNRMNTCVCVCGHR